MITQRATADMVIDQELVAEMLDLLAPSYIDARPVLDRELRNNTTGYLLQDEASRLTAFFLVGFGVPGPIGGDATVYMGLSACREADKNRGQTIRLYRRFIRDAHVWEAQHGKRLRLWATTAHPLVWSICRRFWDVEWPKEDGSYTAVGEELAWALRRQLSERYWDGDHPFICRKVATGTKYSESESERCELARRKLAMDIFGQFQIDERCGDRLLMLARLREEEIPVGQRE
jgi:hypothetical protein